MNFESGTRRALVIAVACALAAPAAAQTWPVRPVRIIVPFSPGGGVDTVTRFLAQKLSEQIDFVFASTTGLVGPAKAGKVRAIAVTGPKRFTELPQVPTIAESGVPGYYVTGWYGFYAPAGTPAEIVQRLHTEARRGLNSPEVAEKLAKTGNVPVASSPAEFSAFVRAEIGKWAKVIKDSSLEKTD